MFNRNSDIRPQPVASISSPVGENIESVISGTERLQTFIDNLTSYWQERGVSLPDRVQPQLADYLVLASAVNSSFEEERISALEHEVEHYLKLHIARRTMDGDVILRELAQDDSEEVRAAVAQNPHTPSDVLEDFSFTDSSWVLASLARNPFITPEIAARLFELSDNLVALHIAANPSTPMSILEQIKTETRDSVRAALLTNPNFPHEWLSFFAEDSQEQIREAVAYHAYTPLPVLMKLTEDRSDHIRFLAFAHPTYRAHLEESNENRLKSIFSALKGLSNNEAQEVLRVAQSMIRSV